MSISLKELSDKVLDVLRDAADEHDTSPDEMIKCCALITAYFMEEVGADSVTTPSGKLTLTD